MRLCVLEQLDDIDPVPATIFVAVAQTTKQNIDRITNSMVVGVGFVIPRFHSLKRPGL